MSIVGFDFFGILSFCGYGLVVEAAVGVVGVGVVESGVVSVGVGVAKGVPVGGADHWGLVDIGFSRDSRDSGDSWEDSQGVGLEFTEGELSVSFQVPFLPFQLRSVINGQ